MRITNVTRERGFVKGLHNAEALGRENADDPTWTEAECPYVRYEHRTCWLHGFRARRKELEK